MAARRFAIARARGSEDVPRVLWYRADELSRALKERGGSEEIQKAKMTRLLIVDDMGWEPYHDTLTEVIAARYDGNRPTAATSGLTQAGFVSRYGDALLRRISEVGEGGVVDTWVAQPNSVPR
jgi:DNA replication protein DnaC